jgi:hypothetical protein
MRRTRQSRSQRRRTSNKPVSHVLELWFRYSSLINGALLLGILGFASRTYFIHRKMAFAEGVTLRSEKRDDLHACQKRLDAMETKVTTVTNAFTNLKIELNGILTAYRVLEVEVETNLPDSHALKHARVILSTAFTVAPSTAE